MYIYCRDVKTLSPPWHAPPSAAYKLHLSRMSSFRKHIMLSHIIGQDEPSESLQLKLNLSGEMALYAILLFCSHFLTIRATHSVSPVLSGCQYQLTWDMKTCLLVLQRKRKVLGFFFQISLPCQEHCLPDHWFCLFLVFF